MKCSEPVLDPETGLPMRFCGTARRCVKTPKGSYWIWIPVAVSSNGRHHRVLPDFLVPYKHYSVQTIESALDNDLDLDRYSLPSDSSVSRWNKWLDKLIVQLRSSLGLEIPPDSLLQQLRVSFRRDVRRALDYDSSSGWVAGIILCLNRPNGFDLGLS